MNDLLTKIRLLRLALNLSQMEVAYQLGIEQSTYSRIERGISPLKVEHLYSISRVFNTSFDEMLKLPVEQLVVNFRQCNKR